MASLNVLVVDPEPAERERLGKVLGAVAEDLERDLTLKEAGDGTTALAMSSEHAFDLVLCEVLLDGLSGLALVRALRGAKKDRPHVFFVTTMSRETDRYWGLRNGALAYFSKPYDETALRDRIKRALESNAPRPDRPVKI